MRVWPRSPTGLSSKGELYLDICAWAPEFLVTPLFMGPVCLLSQARFQKPVHSCTQFTNIANNNVRTATDYDLITFVQQKFNVAILHVYY